MHISIVIPAFNEAASIGSLVRRIKDCDSTRDFEVVVVDDGSNDDTAAVAEAAGATVVRHPYNLGNGASVKSGAAAAAGDVLVFMDADGQHLPEDIPKLLAFIDEYDMVVGARTGDSDVSRLRAVGNYALIKVAEFLVDRKIQDLTSGFRAVKRERFEEFSHLFPQRYSYPTTITMALFSSGRFVKYVPLPSIRRRQAGLSNIQPLRDGLRFLVIMLRIIVLFNPLKIFLSLGAMVMILALINGALDLAMQWRLTASTVLMFTLCFFLFFFGVMADQIARMRREMHMAMTRMSNPIHSEDNNSSSANTR